MTAFNTVYCVIPWYGPEAGGAEYHAHLLCQTLIKQGVNLEVLTTCGKDVGANWYKDAYPAGKTVIESVPVRRFPVRHGRAHRFHALNARLLNNLLLGAGEAEDFFQNSINSDELLSFIQTHAASSAFLLMLYQYGTSVLGSRIAPERSFLLPCFHDEPIAYLPPVRAMFRRVRGILFNTPPEAAIASTLYDLQEPVTEFFGVGVHEDFTAQPERFLKKYNITFPYIVCVGRKDAGKNVYYLAHLFSEYIRDTGSNLHLICIGPGKLSDIPAHAARHILELGFIPEQDKRDAFAGAIAVAQPSNRESYSMVIMEAWLAGVPALVNANCAVTRWLTSTANGGLYFQNYYEFREALDMVFHEKDLRQKLGAQGKEYITSHYRYDDIASRAVRFIQSRLT